MSHIIPPDNFGKKPKFSKPKEAFPPLNVAVFTIPFSYKKKREITRRHSPLSKITPSYKSLYFY
jgi:hypothetical protein